MASLLYRLGHLRVRRRRRVTGRLRDGRSRHPSGQPVADVVTPLEPADDRRASIVS